MQLATGTGANTVDVLGTGVTTHISDYGPATVNVGFGGSVQGIQAALDIADPPSHNTLNIDDSQDTPATAVTLRTVTSGGASWARSPGWRRRRSATSTPTPAACTSRPTRPASRSTCRRPGWRPTSAPATPAPTAGTRSTRRRRQPPGHPRRPLRLQPVQLRHAQHRRLGRHRGAIRDPRLVLARAGRRALGLDRRVGPGVDQLRLGRYVLFRQYLDHDLGGQQRLVEREPQCVFQRRGDRGARERASDQLNP